MINHRLCEGCGDCGEISNCLSVQPLDTPYGRKTVIDQTTCNLDYSCLEGDCPSFVTVTTGGGWIRRLAGRRRSVREETARPPSAPADLPDPVAVVDPDDVSVRITGIGGTGVVTISQVIGTAAMFDGFEVRGLDQIGLSQKAGPVVSDIHLTRDDPADTSRLGEAQADVILAFDQLVAASLSGVSSADPDRTVVVGSTTATPTGAMIAHLDVTMPPPDVLAGRIDEVTREGHRHWADGGAITRALFGDAVTANVFVVGMAVQAGCLPVSADAVERAIELNGVAVDRNIAAFRWGRTQIARPDTVAEILTAAVPAPLTSDLAPAELSEQIRSTSGDDTELESLLTMLATDLVGWQNRSTARAFLVAIAEVAAREADVAPGSTRLTAAVARGLHKLTAYKDEYEVARLMLDAAAMAPAYDLAAATGGRVGWKLHPPVMRSMGRSSKLVFGTWTAPGFRGLARMKWMRGRWLDPFGRSEVRRAERSLPGEYLDAVSRALARLTPERLDDAVALAELPEVVRGYEQIKLDRVVEFRDRLATAVARFG